MTDKVALVRLRAKNDQYDAAMAKSRKATEDLAATSTRFAGMSDKLGKVGSDLNRSVTLPLALAGAASFKLASDFNKTFTQMATLAGVPVSELEGLKQSVLDLAGETGQAPADLADSLYQIYSSGVPASEAMNVLKASAQGASLGLGTAAGVADAVTAAMNTYGAENLSAAQATDQLTAAVKAGKGEASEMAPQLGNLLPLANELGISFSDTAGSLAFLTRGGNNAATASTKLEGVMRALVKPTQQGRDVLEQVGLSAEKLRQVVAEDGLPAALELLQEKFAGNTQLMGKFFEDSEGYIGNLALMKDGGEEWKTVLDDVADSQGLVADGMALLQETPEFKAQQALAELQASMVEIGTQLVPIVSAIAGGIAGLASVFGELPGPLQAGLVGIAMFAAALGPLVGLAGNAAKAVSLFAMAANAKSLDSFRLGLMGITQAGAGASNMLGGLIASFGGMGVVLGTAGGAVAGAALILWDYSAQANRAEKATANLRIEAERTGNTISETFADQLAKMWAGVEGGFNIGPSDDAFRKVMKSAKVGIEELSEALNGSDAEWQAFIDKVTAAATQMGGSSIAGPLLTDLKQLRGAQTDAAHDSDALAAAQRALGVETEKSAGSQSDLAAQTDSATQELNEQADQILGLLDKQRSAIDAQQSYEDSIVAVAESQDAERDAAADVTAAEQELEQAHIDAARAAEDNARAVQQAERALADAYEGREDAIRALADAEEDAAESRETVVEATEELADAQRAAAGDSDEMRDALEAVADAEEGVRQSQADSLEAQEALTRARAEYSTTLAGVKRDAEGAADDVISAEIRLREAQQALADLGKPDEDGNVEPVSADDRVKAELAVREALRRLAEAQEEAAAAKKEAQELEAAGVEGSPAVVAAHDAVRDAADGETEANGRLEDAVQNVADVQVEANGRVQTAQENLEDAILARADADQRVVDARDGVVEANDAITLAADNLRRANEDAATATNGVAAAQKNLADAKDAHQKALDDTKTKLEAVRDAAIDAALAMYAADGQSGLADKLRAIAASLGPDDPLRRHLEDTATALDDIEGDYKVNIMFESTIEGAGAAVVAAGMAAIEAAIPGKAKGGPTQAGRTYLVGEEGPELWSEGTSGYITPAAQTAAILSGNMYPGADGIDYERLAAALESSGRSITVHAPVDARSLPNPEALSTMLSARLGMELALAGAA